MRLTEADRVIFPMNDYRETEIADKRYPSKSADGKTRNLTGTGCFYGCLGIVACIAVLCAVVFLSGFSIVIAGIKQGYESQSWPTVEGRVLSSEIEVSKSTTRDRATGRDRLTTSYHGRVCYEYVVSGQTFASDCISYKTRGGSPEQAYMVIAAYPVGSTVTVHYNPAKPAESVLETGVVWDNFMGLVLWTSPFVLLIAVVGGMLIWARK